MRQRDESARLVHECRCADRLGEVFRQKADGDGASVLRVARAKQISGPGRLQPLEQVVVRDDAERTRNGRRSFSLSLDDGLHQLFRVADLLETIAMSSVGVPACERSDSRRHAGRPSRARRSAGPSRPRDGRVPSHHRLVTSSAWRCLSIASMSTFLAAYYRLPEIGGCAGRISTRLGRLRAGCASRSTTTSATSSGDSFQSASAFA